MTQSAGFSPASLHETVLVDGIIRPRYIDHLRGTHTGGPLPFAMIYPISGYPKIPGQPQNGVPEPSAFPPANE
jgi:hypothetical protein